MVLVVFLTLAYGFYRDCLLDYRICKNGYGKLIVQELYYSDTHRFWKDVRPIDSLEEGRKYIEERRNQDIETKLRKQRIIVE
jgi:hypothetical protein